MMAETNNELMLITVEGSEYSLSKTPPNGSAMVEKMKADITQGLQVGDIVRNLKNISGMLFVAYNALGGTMMQSKVSGLQKDYLQLLDDSGTAITGFKNKSEEICIFVAKAYDWLTRGKESMAITQFDKCAKAAAVMAKTAEGLAARYITMSNQTEHVLEGTQDEQATQYKKMDEMKRQQDEFNAELASQEAMKAQLAQDIESINSVYEDARDREKEAYSTKKGLMITQAVIGCIGAILPFGKSVGGGGGQGSGQASAQAQKDLDEKKQEETGLKQTLTAEQAALDELKKNREPVAAAVKELEQELAVEKGVTGKSEEEHAQAIADLETKLQQKQAELAEIDRQIAERNKSTSTAQQNLDMVSQAVKGIQQQLTALAESAKDDAAAAAAAAKEALKTKLDLEEKRRNTLASIQKFSLLIKSSAEQKNLAATAVQTLQIAIRCLKQVVVALMDASKFWYSMESYCRKMSEGGIGAEIKELSEGLSMEERLEYYTEMDFKMAFLVYMCRWAALYYVCEDYYNQNQAVRQDVAVNIKQAPNREEGYKAAEELAGGMYASISEQIEESRQLSAELNAS